MALAAQATTDTGSAAENLSWSWSLSDGASVVVQDRATVLFHPTYSSGTAAVRGDSGLVCPHHYYWEVKMVSRVYGTDVMVGLATKDMDLSLHRNSFASMIGSDRNSWGYSFHGYVQHGGIKRSYGPGWGMGDVLGVHYDSWRGNIQFYLNRAPLGLAWQGVRAQEMFPVVTSTAAKSEVKLISALSFPSTLQFECFKTLSEILPKSDLLNVYIPPGLRNFVRNNYWFLVMRKSLASNLNDSQDETRERKFKHKRNKPERKRPKRNLGEVFSSDSDDERECILNIRQKKLDLMKKNRRTVPDDLARSSSLPTLSSPHCSSQNLHDGSSHSNQSQQNLTEKTETGSGPSNRTTKKRFYIRR